jgi:hypothetical protein
VEPKHVQNSAAVATVYNYILTEDNYGSRTIIGLLGSYRSQAMSLTTPSDMMNIFLFSTLKK